MIGSSLILGIAAAVAANPGVVGAASAMLQFAHERRDPVRHPRSLGKHTEAARKSPAVRQVVPAHTVADPDAVAV